MNLMVVIAAQRSPAILVTYVDKLLYFRQRGNRITDRYDDIVVIISKQRFQEL